MAKAKREDTPDLMTVQMPEDSGPEVCLSGSTLELDEDRCVQVNAADAALLINSHGGKPFRRPEVAPRRTSGEKQSWTGGQTGGASGASTGEGDQKKS